jgi:lactoylglutathione lyase
MAVCTTLPLVTSPASSSSSSSNDEPPSPRLVLTRSLSPETQFVLDPDSYWVELISQNDVAQTESITTTDLTTYRMNHTMLRVKDKDASLRFYQDVMGMQFLRESPGSDFTLYFLAYGSTGDASDTTTTTSGKTASGNPVAGREGILELTWNHGTEKLEGRVYHDGNAEPQGFGHVAVSVDDLEAACRRFEERGVVWKKKLTDGRMKNVAFLLDPDGYVSLDSFFLFLNPPTFCFDDVADVCLLLVVDRGDSE